MARYVPPRSVGSGYRLVFKWAICHRTRAGGDRSVGRIFHLVPPSLERACPIPSHRLSSLSYLSALFSCVNTFLSSVCRTSIHPFVRPNSSQLQSERALLPPMTKNYHGTEAANFNAATTVKHFLGQMVPSHPTVFPVCTVCVRARRPRPHYADPHAHARPRRPGTEISLLFRLLLLPLPLPPPPPSLSLKPLLLSDCEL